MDKKISGLASNGTSLSTATPNEGQKNNKNPDTFESAYLKPSSAVVNTSLLEVSMQDSQVSSSMARHDKLSFSKATNLKLRHSYNRNNSAGDGGVG